MSEGHPTAPQREVLAILAEEGALSAHQLAGRMMEARTRAPASAGARRTREVSRPVERAGLMLAMASQLVWRLAAQGLVTGGPNDPWSITERGRTLLAPRAAIVSAKGTS
jgi:hypothetical protein